MPDLTIEYIKTCACNLHWHKTVTGSKGKQYEVYFDGSNGERWSCSCPSFQYHKGDCKHIVQAKKEKCNWGIEAFAGSHPNIDPNSTTCPNCGGPLDIVKVGV